MGGGLKFSLITTRRMTVGRAIVVVVLVVCVVRVAMDIKWTTVTMNSIINTSGSNNNNNSSSTTAAGDETSKPTTTTAATTTSTVVSSWFWRKPLFLRSTRATRSSSTMSIQNKKSSNNKTLVILLGNLRCGELAWQSLYDNLLDVPIHQQAGIDLALLIGNTVDPRYQNATLFQRAKYIWYFPEYTDWADAIDLIQGSQLWRKRIQQSNIDFGILLGGALNFTGSGALVFMIRYYLSQKIQKLHLTTIYGRFITTRSDHYYSCVHDLSQLDNNYIWVPEGQNWGGICDRHAVIPAQYINQALDILPPFLRHPIQYKGSDNTEKLLYQRWKKNGLLNKVQRFPRVMFTCAAKGDQTRWRSSMALALEGVGVKYPGEYRRTSSYCPFQKRINKIRTNCTVQFKDQQMAICYDEIPITTDSSSNSTKKSFVEDIVQGILEQHFLCQANPIPAINLQFSSREKFHCLFTHGSSSLLWNQIQPGDHIWGTGINPFLDDDAATIRNSNNNNNHSNQNISLKLSLASSSLPVYIYMVRGPMTRKYFLKTNRTKVMNMQTNKSISVGEPGFLIPFLYPEYYTGVVQRYPKTLHCFFPDRTDDHHYHDVVVQQMIKQIQYNTNQSSLYLSRVYHVNEDWPNILKNMFECQRIITSSMLVMVLANAFGIPCQWYQRLVDKKSTKLEEEDLHHHFRDQQNISSSSSSSFSWFIDERYFEYRDYLMSIGQEDLNQWNPVSSLSLASQMIDLPYPPPIPLQKRKEVANRITKSFPYHLFETKPSVWIKSINVVSTLL